MLLAGLAGLLVYGLHPIRRWRYRRFPDPRYRWLVGHLPEILNLGVERAAERWAQEYGPGPFCFWLGGVPIIQTVDLGQAR